MTALWFWASLVLFAAVTLSGCTQTQLCYAIVGINPPAQLAIVFNQCNGEVIYQNLPPLSTDKAPS